MADDVTQQDDNGLSSPPQGVNPQLFVLLKQKFPTMSDGDIATAIKTSDAQAVQNGQKPPSQQDIGAVSAAIGAGQQQVAQPQAVPTGAPPLPAAQPQAPTAAAQDLLYQGAGPTATRLNAIDPAAIRDAYMKQYMAQGGGSTVNQMGDLFGAAVRSGLGGQANAMGDYQKKWNDINALPAAGEKAAQEAANTGLTAANNTAKTTQENNTAASQLDMAKQKFVTDMGLSNLNLDQQTTAWNAVKGIYDPTSTSSKINQSLAAQMMGLPTSTFTGQSAAEIAAEVKNLDPSLAVNKQAYDQLIAKINADSGRITASAGAASSYANAGATNLGTNLVKNATNGGTTLPVGMNLSIGAGPASITPSAAITGPQATGADVTGNLLKQTTSYDTNGAGTSTDTALKALGAASLTDAGKPGEYLSRIGPLQAATVRTALTGQIQANTPGMTTAEAQKQADALLQSGTPKSIAQQLAQGKATQQANKSVILPSMQAYQQKNGNLNGWTAPQVTKLWNPSTGQTLLSTDSSQTPPKGFVPITNLY